MPAFFAAAIILLHSTRVASTYIAVKEDFGIKIMRANLSQHAGQHSFSRARGHKDTAAGCARQLLRISQTGKQTRRHVQPPSIPLISYTHTHKPPCSLPPGV
jgi:hypothetical protein